jgi:sulfite reductase alpha subunit-like flavoprotein
MNSRLQVPRRLLAGVVVGFAGTILVAACASTPPAPTAALDAAHLAITNAERADAGHYASDELAEARTKLDSANSAVADRQMPSAERLANESRTEAELALARTTEIKAKAVNAEMQRGTGTLIEEMQRNAGDHK